MSDAKGGINCENTALGKKGLVMLLTAAMLLSGCGDAGGEDEPATASAGSGDEASEEKTSEEVSAAEPSGSEEAAESPRQKRICN